MHTNFLENRCKISTLPKSWLIPLCVGTHGKNCDYFVDNMNKFNPTQDPSFRLISNGSDTVIQAV